MEHVHVPVLVAGGGPVGLTTALLLAQHGVPSLLVERHAGTSSLPRANNLNVRTMEVFRAAGIEPQIRQAAAALDQWTGVLRVDSLADADQGWFAEEGDPFAGTASVSPTDYCWCGQDQYEPVLREAAAHAGADLRFGTELAGFDQDRDGVTAVLRNTETGEQYQVRCDHLVGADGTHSFVRTALGVERSGPGTMLHSISILFEADLDAALRGRRFILCWTGAGAGPGALSPVDGQRRWVFAIAFDPERESLQDFTPERCTEAVRAAVADPGLPVRVLRRMSWEAGMAVADRFRTGRVYLAGDAAHQMTPTGGFGANTGIQDAHNLAWKLAWVIRGLAGPGLLDSYATERRAVAAATAEQAALRTLARTGQADDANRAAHLDHHTVMLGYRYGSRAVLGPAPDGALPASLDLRGQPGTRVPHAWVQRNGARTSTLDLVERGFVLLTDLDGAPWQDAARKLGEQRGVPLAAYRVGRDGTADLVDADGAWAQASGLPAGEALLVRPDGFVGWRSDTVPGAAAGHGCGCGGGCGCGTATDPHAVLAGVFGQLLR